DKVINVCSATGWSVGQAQGAFWGMGVREPDLPNERGEVSESVWRLRVASGYSCVGQLNIRNRIWREMNNRGNREYNKRHVNNWVKTCEEFVVTQRGIRKTQVTSLDAWIAELFVERDLNKAKSKKNLKQYSTSVSSCDLLG